MIWRATQVALLFRFCPKLAKEVFEGKLLISNNLPLTGSEDLI